MQVNITGHCLDRIQERKQRNTEEKALSFARFLFIRLFETRRGTREYKGRFVNNWSQGENKYKLTDWKHIFIYERVLGVFNIITYYKNNEW